MSAADELLRDFEDDEDETDAEQVEERHELDNEEIVAEQNAAATGVSNDF